jgi:hypothetical protein
MKGLLIILLVCLVFPQTSCSKIAVIPQKEEITFADTNKSKQILSDKLTTDIQLYGRWWSRQQMAGNWSADNAPAKEGYVRLDNWDASGGNAYPHPNKVDIICMLQNGDEDLKQLRMIAVVNFRIASYREITNLSKDEEFETKLQNIAWSKAVTIGEKSQIDLKAKESREIKFTDFNLIRILNKYFESKDDLWPWKMRVRVKILDRNGAELLLSEKVIDLIPGD